MDWKPAYGELSIMDRIVKSIFTLTQFAKEEYELLTSKQKSQILFIDYYDLVSKPNDSMEILSQFVKRGFDINVSKVIRSLGLPRQMHK